MFGTIIPIYYGKCGKNLYWSYDETTYTLSFIGSGKMDDYTIGNQPWNDIQEQIRKVIIPDKMFTIGQFAFAGCKRLGEVIIGNGLEDIAANAFANCNRLYHVYCNSSYPPLAEETSFENYNFYLHIPFENKEGYELDVVWGKFKHIVNIEE